MRFYDTLVLIGDDEVGDGAEEVDGLLEEGDFHKALIEAEIHQCVFIVYGDEGEKDADIVCNPVVPDVTIDKLKLGRR